MTHTAAAAAALLLLLLQQQQQLLLLLRHRGGYATAAARSHPDRPQCILAQLALGSRLGSQLTLGSRGVWSHS